MWLLTGLSCSAAPVQSSVFVKPSDGRVRLVGWFDTRVADAPRFAWPGTQVEVAFRGTSLRARFSDSSNHADFPEPDQLAVIIDDKPATTLPLKLGTHDYTLADGLPPGMHTARIWKRTEALVGTVTFHGFPPVKGTQLEVLPAARTRRLVFFGDSITAGYGNEGASARCRWSATTENNHATYGAVAARALKANYVAAAWSGKGVTRNFDPTETQTLPMLFDRVIPNEDDSPRVTPKHADALVVNLGTNDFFHGIPEERPFVDTFSRFVNTLRGRYPKALLVLVLGPMLTDDVPQPMARTTLRGWLQKLQAQRRVVGDDRVDLLELASKPEEGLGCGSHPNVTTHTRLGRELAAHLKQRLQW